MHSKFHIGFAVVLLGPALLAANGPCKTTPVSVSISPTYTFGTTTSPAMIYPDNASAYVDGANGVSAYINTTCTNDLIVNLNSSSRKVGFSFLNALETNSSTPAFTGTPFLAQGSYLVISNLMFNYSPNAWYQFSTSASLSFTPPGGSSKSQARLIFSNPQANVYVPTGNNQPMTTSLIIVTHSPANPTTGAAETWTITPDSTNMNPAGSPAATQVGTLDVPASHNTLANAGQFGMPFQFTVTRK